MDDQAKTFVTNYVGEKIDEFGFEQIAQDTFQLLRDLADKLRANLQRFPDGVVVLFQGVELDNVDVIAQFVIASAPESEERTQAMADLEFLRQHREQTISPHEIRDVTGTN